MGGNSLKNYTDESRGRFQNDGYAKQTISFDGLRFKGRNGLSNVTPTDIDGLVQLDNENCFIFFELKYMGGVPSGQAGALTKLCDAVQAGGVNCVVFVAEHSTPYPQTIIAKDATVKRIYWNGRWYAEPKQRKLYEIALNFISFIKEST